MICDSGVDRQQEDVADVHIDAEALCRIGCTVRSLAGCAMR